MGPPITCEVTKVQIFCWIANMLSNDLNVSTLYRTIDAHSPVSPQHC